MTHPDDHEPPRAIRFTLDEALALLADLEDARDGLIEGGYLAPVMGVEVQSRLLNERLGFDDSEGMTMARKPLRATQAARQLGMPTKELLRLIHERKIRYVMVKGIAHVPTDALDEYRKRAS